MSPINNVSDANRTRFAIQAMIERKTAAEQRPAAPVPDTRPESLAEDARDPLDPARGIGSAILLVLILSVLGCALVTLFNEWVAAGGWLR